MLFTEFTRRIGSSLLIGSPYHKNTNARQERVNGVPPMVTRTTEICSCPSSH